ncbi:carbohydrate ABC transporter permease [Blautia schinkii]|nr:carbohydrate ABC transporter permease [Blautia schinkii]
MIKRERRKGIITGVILWLFSIVFLYPIAMVVLTSFKSKAEANVLSVELPTQWLFENYAQVWEKGKIFRSAINSLQISVISVILILCMAASLSFILVRRNTKGCRLISRVLTFGIIAPMAILPTVELLKRLGIYGNKFSLIPLYAALYLPFSSMLFSSFIKGIPRELDEAAAMDGAKGIGLFARVVFPLLKPVTATTGILTFMWIWNDFQYPLYLLNSSANWTLPLSVYNFYGQFSRSWNLVCADMVVVSLPVVLVYFCAQKYVIEGMTAGAVKG